MARLILTKTDTVAERLAQAYEQVAAINHYMVGVVGAYSWEDYSAAYQLLIKAQNNLLGGGNLPPSSAKARWARLDLALNLLEQDCQSAHNCKP